MISNVHIPFSEAASTNIMNMWRSAIKESSASNGSAPVFIEAHNFLDTAGCAESGSGRSLSRADFRPDFGSELGSILCGIGQTLGKNLAWL